MDDQRQDAHTAAPTHATPTGRVNRMWGGLGSGAPCTRCGAAMATGEMALEIELEDRGGGPHEPPTYEFHVLCFRAWEAERPHERGPEHAHPGTLRKDPDVRGGRGSG